MDAAKLHADPLVQAWVAAFWRALPPSPVPPPVVSAIKCGACNSDLIDHDFVVERANTDGEFAGLTFAQIQKALHLESVYCLDCHSQLPNESRPLFRPAMPEKIVGCFSQEKPDA